MRLRFVHLALLVWCSLMTATVPTRADEFSVKLDQVLDVQSNAFRNVINPVRDGRYQLSPTVQVKRTDSELTYRLHYRPIFFKYFRTTELDGWDQFVVGTLGYRLTPQDTVRMTGSFSQFRVITTTGTEDALGQPVILRDDSGTVRRFFADFDYDHSFTARIAGGLGVDFQRFAYIESLNVDNSALSGTARLTWAYDPRLTLGASFLGRYRIFDGRGTRPGSTTTILNPNLIVRLKLGPTLSLDLNGGPSGILIEEAEAQPATVPRYLGGTNTIGQTIGREFDPATCGQVNGQPVLSLCPPVRAPVLDGQIPSLVTVDFEPGQRPIASSRSGLTYFLLAELEKTFARGSASVWYQRSEDGASGTGASTIMDSVTARIEWSPAELWTTSLYGFWSRRRSAENSTTSVIKAGDSGLLSDGATGVPIAEAVALIAAPEFTNFQIDQFFVDLSVGRKLTENSSLRVYFQYQRQKQRFLDQRTFDRLDNFLLAAAFRYEFDPFRF